MQATMQATWVRVRPPMLGDVVHGHDPILWCSHQTATVQSAQKTPHARSLRFASSASA